MDPRVADDRRCLELIIEEERRKVEASEVLLKEADKAYRALEGRFRACVGEMECKFYDVLSEKDRQLQSSQEAYEQLHEKLQGFQGKLNSAHKDAEMLVIEGGHAAELWRKKSLALETSLSEKEEEVSRCQTQGRRLTTRIQVCLLFRFRYRHTSFD